MRKVLAALAASSCMIASAQAIEINPMDGFPDTIVITGAIDYGDHTKLYNVMQYRASRGIATNYVMLHSGGGNLYSGSMMAQTIRGYNLVTVVDGNAECASACMLMFAAGSKRVAWAGAMLGVHNASFRGDDDSLGTVLMAKELAYYGAPDNIIGKTVITPSDSMTWLSDADVAGWVEIMTDGATTAYAPEPQPSVSFGDLTMTCKGDVGSYNVWLRTSAKTIRVNNTVWGVNDMHTNENTLAFVAGGATKYGTYSAVFGGPNPRIVYEDGKDQVTDYCVF